MKDVTVVLNYDTINTIPIGSTTVVKNGDGWDEFEGQTITFQGTELLSSGRWSVPDSEDGVCFPFDISITYTPPSS